MVKVTEEKRKRGVLICISDIPGNVMGSELDKFLCIAHLLLMGDEPTKHFYLQKLGLSTEPTGYAMFISNDLMSGNVKFSDKETEIKGYTASDIVRSRFGAEYVGVGIKFIELLKEWLQKEYGEYEWTKNQHVHSERLRNLQTKTVHHVLGSFGASCTT